MRRNAVSVSALVLLRQWQRCGAVHVPCRHNISPGPPPPPAPPSPSQPTIKYRLPQDEGISEGLGGFGLYTSSITAFMKPQPKDDKDKTKAACMHDGCSHHPPTTPNHTTTTTTPGMMGRHVTATSEKTRTRVSPAHSHATPLHREKTAAPPQSQSPQEDKKAEDERKKKERETVATPQKPSASSTSSLPRNPNTVAARRKVEAEVTERARQTPRPDLTQGFNTAAAAEAAYNDFLNAPQPSKEEMWSRIRAAQADQQQRQQQQQQQQARTSAGVVGAEAAGTALDALEVDYLKMEEEMKEVDLFHFRMGEYAFPDATLRRDYYTLWSLATSLNKARWTMLDVHSQRGVKTTGAGVKLLFWKDSVASIVERRKGCEGIFASSHPVLRPFAALVQRHPNMTRAFLRGFTDARLKVLQQPGNLKQLADHYDKFYGYFYNSLLELIGVKDESAEHVMLHIGRATGLTLHCVLLWKKYAKVGMTMLPAELCAEKHVNLALLTNIPLASRDLAVREILFDLMCVVKEEMLHAREAAKHAPPAAWPVIMEGLFPNYYLGFLQRHKFDVSAMMADYNIENPGLVWYRMKKRWQWQRHRSLELLLDEAAPLPFIGTSLGHRGSKYKVRSDMGGHSKHV